MGSDPKTRTHDASSEPAAARDRSLVLQWVAMAGPSRFQPSFPGPAASARVHPRVVAASLARFREPPLAGQAGALSDSSHGVRLKDAPPSTSNVRVRSQLAVVPARRGVLRTGHAVHGAYAPGSAATSLRAFGPGLPHRDSFRPCRFSRLRRLAPRTRCRSVAPCSRSWGSPGCRLGPCRLSGTASGAVEGGGADLHLWSDGNGSHQHRGDG